jgi:competence protein ComEA
VLPTVPGAIPPADTSTANSTPLINLNSATSAQLDTLPGVGPSTAKAIISYRNRKGPFGKVEDLLNVPGIGPAKIAALRDQVTV